MADGPGKSGPTPMKGFAADTEVRLFNGAVKRLRDLRPGDQLVGDDNNPRVVQDLQLSKTSVYYRLTYKPYLDSGYDGVLLCGGDAVIAVVPDGNRAAGLSIGTDAQKNYVVEFVEPVLDRDSRIVRVEQKKRSFQQPEEVLAYVDKQLPNFLYEPRAQEFVRSLPPETQRFFSLVRPLLPIRFQGPALLQQQTKALFDQAKELGLKSMDLPWACGLFLAAGSGAGERVVFNLSQLHRDVSKELKRVFELLKCPVEQDEETGVLQASLQRSRIFLQFLQAFNLYQPDTNSFSKDALVKNIALESFSKIRGPFLAGVMDGSADYGLGDSNYGLECYIRGLPQGQTRQEIADLARSCSLACIEEPETGILTLAGGMLFRIPCVNNPPKDIPGLVCLTSYPNEEGQNVLLGMPMELRAAEVTNGPEIEVAHVEFSGQLGRFLLADYTVVGM